MAELLDYALETGKVNAEQLLRARDARVKLKQAGVRKTLEEAAILCSVLTREQHASIAQELQTYRGIQAPEPQVATARQEEDDEFAGRWRGQGRREEVDLGLKRQTELRLAGFAIPLWEILQGLGLEIAAPEPPSPPPPPVTELPAAKPAPKPVVKPILKIAVPPRPIPEAKPPAPPMSPQKKLTIGLSAAGGAVLLSVIGFVLFYDPSAPPPPAPPPPVAVKAVKPPEPPRPPEPETPPAPVPEAQELYVLEDRINALGLVSVVHLLRKKESEAKALTGEMEKVRKLLEEKMSAVVAAGRSIPLGHRLHEQDEILAIRDKPLWNDPQQLVGTARWLEDEVLRGLKAGQPVNVVLNRQGRRLEFTLQFHSDPSWPEPK